MPKRRKIRFSPVEGTLMGLMVVLLLLNFWQGRQHEG